MGLIPETDLPLGVSANNITFACATGDHQYCQGIIAIGSQVVRGAFPERPCLCPHHDSRDAVDRLTRAIVALADLDDIPGLDDSGRAGLHMVRSALQELRRQQLEKVDR
jgi:hypothetical protein